MSNSSNIEFFHNLSNFTLSLGCFLIAFSPLLSFFFLIIYRKSQLVIIVTSAAFSFLLSTLFASLIWKLFQLVWLGDIWVSILIPGIISQFICRCLFVSLYHRVERVIRLSIEKENEDNNNATDDDDVATTNSNGNINTIRSLDASDNMTSLRKLRLQLNDASCGMAAGIGYGGMHTILFYGTLLASEGDNIGTLYQQSCPNIPGLAQSAIFALCFSILDIFWMLFAFFGMRRRLMYSRGGSYIEQQQNPNSHLFNHRRTFGKYFGNSRSGGNMALLTSLLTHIAASLITLSSNFNYGCNVSLPALIGLTFFVIYIFWSGVSKIYMPPENAGLSISRTASRIAASDSNINNNNGIARGNVPNNASLGDSSEEDSTLNEVNERPQSRRSVGNASNSSRVKANAGGGDRYGGPGNSVGGGSDRYGVSSGRNSNRVEM